MKRYLILSKFDIEELVILVQHYMDMGWQLEGGVSFGSDRDGPIVAQAVSKADR